MKLLFSLILIFWGIFNGGSAQNVTSGSNGAQNFSSESAGVWKQSSEFTDLQNPSSESAQNIISALLIQGTQGTDDDGHCVWYGECSHTESGKTLNCAYNGTAKVLLDQEALRIVRDLCPDLVGDDPAPKLCCDARQIHTLETNLGVPRQLFARCPSCSRNFAQLWCQSTCSPVQSRFINVTKKKGKPEYVEAIEYHITDQFVYGLYNSCRSVQNPGTNQPALSLVCGMPADKCTVDKWLTFMGDTHVNPMVPFDIKFIHYSSNETHPDTIDPQNGTIYPCSMAPDNKSLPCSCQDCQASCSPVAPYPAPAEGHCTVGSMDCWIFLAILTFSGFTFGILLVACLHYVITGRRQLRLADQNDAPGNKAVGPAEIAEKDVTLRERVGAWTENKLESAFNTWGRLCTRHPVMVFLMGLMVSFVCSCGLYFMQVTTDPVKLWSSPNSRARLEKDYFDSKFGPFYRTEQIILVPKNLSFFTAADLQTGEMISYGPVFTKEFLHQALRLQDAIVNLRAERGDTHIMLSDVCFQPLAPDNDGCMIMSVLNYFQNNQSLIDYQHEDPYQFPDSDYLSHLRSCFDDPTQLADSTPGHLPCMAEFGGPIFPYMVLSGYEGGEYKTATALVIIFVVSNDEDPATNQMAEAWELKFIEYMTWYSLSTTNVTVIFSAERSIRDVINQAEPV